MRSKCLFGLFDNLVVDGICNCGGLLSLSQFLVGRKLLGLLLLTLLQLRGSRLSIDLRLRCRNDCDGSVTG